MASLEPRPDTIDTLRYGADASFAMLAGIQLDVFTPLQNGPRTADQIAESIGIAPTRLPLLLYALVAAGLLTEANGKFANTSESQHFLVKGSPAYMGDMHGQLSGQWANKLKTAESLQTGIPQAHLDFAQAPQEELEVFLRGMHTRGTGDAAYTLAEHYDFSAATTLVDVGGGGGGLAIAFTKVCPHLQATVVDLPQVTPITQKIVDEEGATDRVTIRAADVVHDPLPGRYDVAVVQNFLQVLSFEDAQRAVEHIGAALNPGGTIYIIGFMLDDSHLSPPGAVGANLNFINIYYAGASYTEQEYRVWLREAGLVDIERADFSLAGGRSLIMACKRS
jgi:SAM-dependent methyltransferase